jgi:acetyltransferase-like isoleucine patch superfamily enzyme
MRFKLRILLSRIYHLFDRHPGHKYGDGIYIYFYNKIRCKVSAGKGSYADLISVMANKNQTLRIGKYVSIGRRLNIIMCGGHNLRVISTYPFKDKISYTPFFKKELREPAYELGDVTIGNDVWIGDDVTIMGGGEIGDGAVIGTKSLVTSNQKLKEYGVYAGIPAKFLYYRFSPGIIKELKKLKWWDMKEEIIKNKNYLLYNPNIKSALSELKKLKKRNDGA